MGSLGICATSHGQENAGSAVPAPNANNGRATSPTAPPTSRRSGSTNPARSPSIDSRGAGRQAEPERSKSRDAGMDSLAFSPRTRRVLGVAESLGLPPRENRDQDAGPLLRAGPGFLTSGGPGVFAVKTDPCQHVPWRATRPRPLRSFPTFLLSGPRNPPAQWRLSLNSARISTAPTAAPTQACSSPLLPSWDPRGLVRAGDPRVSARSESAAPTNPTNPRGARDRRSPAAALLPVRHGFPRTLPAWGRAPTPAGPLARALRAPHQPHVTASPGDKSYLAPCSCTRAPGARHRPPACRQTRSPGPSQ